DRCDSRFPPMRRAPAACSQCAYTCAPGPRPARTTAGSTARPYWLRGRSAMRSTALIGLMLWRLSCSSHKGFLIFACIALALMAVRRLNNAIVSWTDLEDLATYAWLASVMWAPAVAAWILAWNRWRPRPWRSIDVSAVVLAAAAIIGAVMHSASVTRGSR